MAGKGSSGQSAKASWRNIPERDRAILWGRAAARCCFPDCRRVLIHPASEKDSDAIFGQVAHIVAHSPGGPRADNSLPQEKLDKYENLILLCGNHHTIVDKQPNTYVSQDLLSWKAEHEAWVLARTEPDRYMPARWRIVLQEDEPQIDVANAVQAISPDVPAGEPIHVRVGHREKGWAHAAQAQREIIETAIGNTPASEMRFAVFSLTRIPLAIHLGFVFSDRCRVATYQYHRDEGTWRWPNEKKWIPDIVGPQVKMLRDGNGPALVRISLSASISEQFIQTVTPTAIADLHLYVERPSVTWLREPDQLLFLNVKYRELLTLIREGLGERCTGIHILYAGPTGGAIALGRAINPRMNPPVHTYEYHHGATPRYEPALILGGS